MNFILEKRNPPGGAGFSRVQSKGTDRRIDSIATRVPLLAVLIDVVVAAVAGGLFGVVMLATFVAGGGVL